MRTGGSYADLMFEGSADHLTEASKAVGLLEDGRTFFQEGNEKLCFRGVASRKDDANAGPQSGYLQISFRAAQRRHDDIHDNQIDLMGIGLEELKSFLAIGGNKNAISERLQHFLRGIAKRIVIFGQQDGFRAPGRLV